MQDANGNRLTVRQSRVALMSHKTIGGKINNKPKNEGVIYKINP